jgi:hypothetical protein
MPWILAPQSAYAIEGFVLGLPEGETLGQQRAFRVVDATESLAVQRKFTQQLGLITAAFYEAQAVDRGGLGVALGTERRQDIQRETRFTPGRLAAVLHLHYVWNDSDAP